MLELLPVELCVYILRYLDRKSLLKTSEVSRHLYTVISHNRRRLIGRLFESVRVVRYEKGVVIALFCNVSGCRYLFTFKKDVQGEGVENAIATKGLQGVSSGVTVYQQTIGTISNLFVDCGEEGVWKSVLEVLQMFLLNAYVDRISFSLDFLDDTTCEELCELLRDSKPCIESFELEDVSLKELNTDTLCRLFQLARPRRSIRLERLEGIGLQTGDLPQRLCNLLVTQNLSEFEMIDNWMRFEKGTSKNILKLHSPTICIEDSFKFQLEDAICLIKEWFEGVRKIEKIKIDLDYETDDTYDVTEEIVKRLRVDANRWKRAQHGPIELLNHNEEKMIIAFQDVTLTIKHEV